MEGKSPIIARPLDLSDAAYCQFTGKITVESSDRNPDPRNAVMVGVTFDGMSCTGAGLGSALAMVARQYVDALPEEFRAASLLALVESFRRVITTEAAKRLKHGGLQS